MCASVCICWVSVTVWLQHQLKNNWDYSLYNNYSLQLLKSEFLKKKIKKWRAVASFSLYFNLKQNQACFDGTFWIEKRNEADFFSRFSINMHGFKLWNKGIPGFFLDMWFIVKPMWKQVWWYNTAKVLEVSFGNLYWLSSAFQKKFAGCQKLKNLLITKARTILSFPLMVYEGINNLFFSTARQWKQNQPVFL